MLPEVVCHHLANANGWLLQQTHCSQKVSFAIYHSYILAQSYAK
jgi:hypothetical protein